MEHRVKTVKAIMQELGQQKLIEAVIEQIESYRTAGPVHEGIIKTKIRQMFLEFEENPEAGEHRLILLKHLSTQAEDWESFEYTDRFAFFYAEDVLLRFQAIPAWDSVIGTEDTWSPLNFFDLSNLEVILLSKFSQCPKQLLWDWNRWKEILHAELMGAALDDPEETVVKLCAKYMEFLLGNVGVHSETKMYPYYIMPEQVSAEDLTCERKMQLIQDRLLCELSIYGEVRQTFRNAQKHSK